MARSCSPRLSPLMTDYGGIDSAFFRFGQTRGRVDVADHYRRSASRRPSRIASSNAIIFDHGRRSESRFVLSSYCAAKIA